MTSHILVNCHSCGRTLKAPVIAIGKTGTCPQCQSKLLIQQPPQERTSTPSVSPCESDDAVTRSASESLAPPISAASAASAHTVETAEEVERAPSRGRSARKESYSADRMMAVIGKVEECRQRLLDLHSGLTKAGVTEIQVDGHAMLVRGLNQIENFIDNANRALREAKR